MNYKSSECFPNGTCEIKINEYDKTISSSDGCVNCGCYSTQSQISICIPNNIQNDSESCNKWCNSNCQQATDICNSYCCGLKICKTC